MKKLLGGLGLLTLMAFSVFAAPSPGRHRDEAKTDRHSEISLRRLERSHAQGHHFERREETEQRDVDRRTSHAGDIHPAA